MKKFKKILLGALSALTLGLFVVTGTKVDAAVAAPDNDTYTVTASDFYGGVAPTDNYKADSKSSAAMTLVQHNFITLDSGTNYYEKLNVDSISVDTNSTYTKTSTSYGVRMGGGRKITLTLADNQIASIQLVGYSSGSNKKIKVGSSSGTELYNFASSAKIYDINLSQTFDSSTNVLYLEGSVSIVSMTITVSSVTTYNVTFNSMGGSSVATQTIAEGKKATEPTAPTKANNRFVGWYTSTDNGTTLSDTAFNFENTTITGDLTLYAKWEEATVYTVTFMDGTETYATKYVYDGENDNKVTDWPADPMKAGYTFSGWYNSTTSYTSNSVFNSNVTLTANYTEFSALTTNSTYSFDASNTTSNSDGSVINSTNETFFMDNVAGKGVKVSGSNFSFANGSDSTTQQNYLGFNIPANTYVIISVVGTATHDVEKDKHAQIDCKLNGTTVTTGIFESTNTTYEAILYNKTDDVSMVQLYRNGNTTLTVSSISVSVYSSVETENEAQSRGTGTAIRFAATISNVGSLDVITKWNYTLSMDGKSDVVGADKTTLYTAISGTNGKAAADNTYYIVLTVNNIPSSFNGKALKCKFTITLSDGSTIDTDVVSEPINVTA